MAIYKKVSGPNDVMTFCGEKKPMGLRIIRIIQNGASPRLYDYELYELYEFPKRGHPPSLRLRIIRIAKTEDVTLDYELYELYEFSYADTTGTNSYNSFNS